MTLACGKRRPPLPPVERVPQRTELLSGIQRGDQVILVWPAPLRNAPANDVENINRIDIYRLAEPISAPLPLTEEEFAARSTLIGSIPSDVIRRNKDILSYVDQLSIGEPVRLRYAVRYVNAQDQRAAFSNFLLVEPAARISQPPVIAEVVNPTQNSIVVRWQPPSANVDKSTTVNLLGYNIYRTTSAQNESAQTPRNPQLLTTTEYIDNNFSFDTEYTYFVRAVSLGTGGAPVESLNSNAKSITPRDIFPPSAPVGLGIAPAPKRLSLFFAANPERDVVGYHIYRSIDPDLPKDKWTRLTRAPISRTTFTDETVESGKKYFYYLKAIDAAGNMSEPSEVVAETVP
ncbi:MAG: hypothetical protein NVSMB56_13600 [Pyrinomonadaceae bacterium]